MIPPNIYYNKPNPAIPFEEWNMAVPTKLTPWPVVKTKRVSVSGFGMGGTNGHVVLEGINPAELKSRNNLQINGTSNITPPASRKRLFVFSSHDQVGLERVGSVLDEHLEQLGPAASSTEYLANLAHTLAVARSGHSWKSSCVAETTAELRHHLSSKPGISNNAARASDKEPRIGFIFTGQGAQWAGMGVELLKTSPVFCESVKQSAAFLKSFGCDWDPIEELSRPNEESRLKMPKISQPICTVLQVALVDELRSWGITPKKVVGHSSGEIAGAYAAGALSHRDAVAGAYFRGQASAKAVGLKGGMLAVGCSFKQAIQLLVETSDLHNGKVGVACVNSPGSVTLSGDLAELDKMREFLTSEKIFARALQVDCAYHSKHMETVSAEYLDSISDIEPNDDDDVEEDKRVIMVSSITGSEVSLESMGPLYWVRNLVSPVLFDQALSELVRPDNSEDNAVDLLIEIGPHSALGGPVEQILADRGVTGVGYKSVLTRLQNPVNTTLKLASELLIQGVELDIQKVNGDSNRELLTNLPPYPWNHSKVLRCESRIAKELLHQKFPTKSLLGAPSPMMDETQHVWRGFLRLEDEPWLRGHMVGSTVLLPGAGMMSIILEASQQLVQPGKTARAFRLRDIWLAAAMALPEGVPVEVITHIRPYFHSTLDSTSAWWEFTMSSCVGGDQLRDNCRGLMVIDYEEDTSEQMAKEEASIQAARIADYHRINKENPIFYSQEKFYNHMESAAWKYGEVFQGIQGCQIGDGQSTYKIRINDIGETWSKDQIERPFLITGATLDAVFQSWLSSTWKGGEDGCFDFTKPFVPMSIGEIEVSAAFPGEVGYILPGLTLSERYGFNDLSAEMVIFDKDVSRTVLTVKDFRTSELYMDGGVPGRETAEVDPADITSEFKWNYALDVMKPEEFQKVVCNIAPENRLTEVARMAVHIKPAGTLLELVSDLETGTAISKFPPGTVLPHQVRYAVAAKTGGAKGSIDAAEILEVGDLENLPKDISPVDTLIITDVTEETGIINYLAGLAKPEATAVVSSKKNSQFARSALEAAGFSLFSIAEGNGQSTALYSKKASSITNGVNGVSSIQAVFLEPESPAETTRAFSKTLQKALQKQGFSTSTRTLADGPKGEVSENEILISLLEVEEPVLDHLSERDYNVLKDAAVQYQRLLWVTCTASPAKGIIDGWSRTVESEMAGTRFQVLHLSPATGMQYGPELATRILTHHDTKDDEFHEVDGVLQITRIYPSPTENSAIRHHLEDSIRMSPIDAREDLRLTVGRPGLMDTLHFIEDDRLAAPLGDDEVEIEVKASGVNFRDIMAAMGLIPMSLLGQEGSGVITQVGRNGDKFKVGDRVGFLGIGTHSTRIRVDNRIITRIPDSLSFEEAAAMPVAHTTAYHALVNLAKLRKGQSVLIHAAAGGVGQAAIQIAKNLGLVIYVTVGSSDKAKLLTDTYGIPQEHIFYSRDVSFAKGIQRMTKGKGVDCVLNSLSGELLRTSFECLAAFGTFVEIGLRDILNNSRLDMRPFGKSATFTFFNQFALYEEDPAVLGQILQDTFKLVHEGVLHAPAPLTVSPVGQAAETFRTIQQGKHRGKMVLSFSNGSSQVPVQAPILRKAKDSLKLDPDVTYLLVGGLGGLGRSLAREFIACGARNIAFMSRSGDGSAEAKALLEDLTQRGAKARAYKGDVADPASFKPAMSQMETELPPVVGVVQMAMALRDIVFEKMPYDWWRTGLSPKVQGTWNLHEYFGPGRKLDFFIICSSISGTYGYPSQAQYSAGNTYQDTLAHYRRSLGLKAVSVNLGIMRDVGVLAEQGATGNFLLWEETLGIREPAFHALFKGLINRQKSSDPSSWPPAQVTTGLGTADIMSAHGLDQPNYFSIPRFAPLAVSSNGGSSSGGQSDKVSLAMRLGEAANKDEAVQIIKEGLVKKVAEILSMPESEVDSSRPMYRYGVDSLVALEVRNWITTEMKATVALLEVLAAVPMDVFAARIADKSKLVSFE